MSATQQSWIVRVQVPMKQPMWCGNFNAGTRELAKREARRFVAGILPLDTIILGIARGEVSVRMDGPEFPP